MTEQNHDARAEVSHDTLEAGRSDDPQVAQVLKAPVTPVQALRREQLLDALAALLRQGALPDDPPQHSHVYYWGQDYDVSLNPEEWNRNQWRQHHCGECRYRNEEDDKCRWEQPWVSVKTGFPACSRFEAKEAAP
jgi:hypothetical protein